MITAAAFFLAAAPGRAQENPWCLLIEPKFMGYDVAWTIPGAKNTVLVPARLVDGEPRPLTHAELAKLHPTPEEIEKEARISASAESRKLKPEYQRDEKGIIQYAVLASESPLTAASVLAPEFCEQFADTLGPDILVAIPNRFKVFVFPKLSPAYQQLADLVAAEYGSSPHPVSRELFEVKNGRLRALGAYR